VEKAYVMRQVGTRKTIVVEVSLGTGDTRTGATNTVPGQVWRVPEYWPGGVRHIGDVSLVCCSGTERGKARPDTAALVGGERERPKRLQPQGTGYRRCGCAGGPARSSGEAPVTGVERRAGSFVVHVVGQPAFLEGTGWMS
jgi:hypothetical protein